MFRTLRECAHAHIKRAMDIQEADDNFFSTFNSDTKLAVVDHSPNVKILNGKEDMINYIPLTEDTIPERSTK